MLKYLRTHALYTAFLLLSVYLVWLSASTTSSLSYHQNLSGIEKGIAQWKNQLVVGSVLIVVLSLLGWWHKVGFVKMNRESWKFLLPIAVLALFILNMAWVMDESQNGSMGFADPMQFFSLVLIMLSLGFTEEVIFRGILYHGLQTKFTPFATIVLVGVIFGLFHYVNFLGGQHFIETSMQVIHAAAMGFLYAALRLSTGAIWPLIILHGLWDFSLFTLTTVQAQQGVEAGAMHSFSPAMAVSIALPATLYGIFVYWRWSKNTMIDQRIQMKGSI